MKGTREMFKRWMVCRRMKCRMHLYLDGDLSPEAKEAFRAHLDSCAGCREAFERLAQGEALVRAHFRETVEGAGAPEDFWAGFEGRLRARRAPAGPRLMERWLAPVGMGVAVVVIGMVLRGKPAAPPAQQAELAQERKELAQIRVSLQEMEAELNRQVQQWR